MKEIFENLSLVALKQIARKYNKHVKISNLRHISKEELVNTLSRKLHAVFDSSTKMLKLFVKEQKQTSIFDYSPAGTRKPPSQPRQAKAKAVKAPAKAKAIKPQIQLVIKEKPLAKQPLAKQPLAKQPLAKQPLAKQPSVKKPTAKKISKKMMAFQAPAEETIRTAMTEPIRAINPNLLKLQKQQKPKVYNVAGEYYELDPKNLSRLTDWRKSIENKGLEQVLPSQLIEDGRKKYYQDAYTLLRYRLNAVEPSDYKGNQELYQKRIDEITEELNTLKASFEMEFDESPISFPLEYDPEDELIDLPIDLNEEFFDAEDPEIPIIQNLNPMDRIEDISDISSVISGQNPVFRQPQTIEEARALIVNEWKDYENLYKLINTFDRETGQELFNYINYLNQRGDFIIDTNLLVLVKPYINPVIAKWGIPALFEGINNLAFDYEASLYMGSFYTKDSDFSVRKGITSEKNRQEMFKLHELLGMGMKGGVMPVSNAIAHQMEESAYSSQPVQEIAGWSLITPYSSGVKAYRRGNTIMLAIRGTGNLTDVYADARMANGSLNKSQRYIEDKNYILGLQREYNPQDFFYFGVGHSLGGAICDILIDEGLIQEAVSYNPAVEYKYYRNTKNHRIYNRDDPLYKLMGVHTINPEVRANKLSTLDTLAGFTTAGKLKNTLQAHSLSKFKGGDFADTLADAFGIDRQGSVIGETGKLISRILPVAKLFA
jgi:hypothetical protein